MDVDDVLLTAEEHLEKAVTYLKDELRGVRTGRASTGLVEFIKVEYYGSLSDLRQLALISVPEPTQILIKPFDASSTQNITKAIQNAGLGLNPLPDGKQIRLAVPPLSGERRSQLVGSVKQMGEHAKVALRNSRREANKQVDLLAKDKSSHLGEDEADAAKAQVQDLLKKYEGLVAQLIDQKSKEIQQF